MQLQISTVRTKELGKNTRLDPEYYSPSNLDLNKALLIKDVVEVTDIASVTDGIHASISFSDTSNINLISAMSPKNNYFDTSKTGYIDELQHLKNPRTQLRDEDIILSTVGTIGNCAVVDETILPANSDRHVGIIRLKSKQWKSRYISTFLLSKYGRFQTLREATGNVQLNLFIDKIKTLIIPKSSKRLQDKVEELVFLSNRNRQIAKNALEKVNQQLLQNFGLDNFTPITTNYSSRSFNDYLTSNRLDSEYWLPKYDEIEAKIKSYKEGYDSFDKLVKISTDTIKVEQNEKYKYAELANVNASVGLIEEPSELSGNELPSRAKMKLRKNDVVLSSIEGSADKVAIVNADLDNLVGSTGFFVLKEDYFLPEAILALLRVPYINALFKRQAQGTILTAVPKSSLSRVILPKLSKPYQEEIAKQVQQAHILYENSKYILKVAKRAIEVFVEEDEEKALSYIQQNYEQV